MAPQQLIIIARNIRLAEALRNQGWAALALPELEPTLRDLERASIAGQSDRDFALTHVDALLALALVYGDLSSERETTRAVAAGLKAVELCERYADPAGLAYALNTAGNQSRIIGHLSRAKNLILRAAALESGWLAQGASASWLARIASQQGDYATFALAISEARRALDKIDRYTSLVNPTSVGEIEVRGLLALGKINRAARLQPQLNTMDGKIAPQWRIIISITAGELLIALGDEQSGLATLSEAASLATHQYMPHQLERIARAARRVKSCDSTELAREVDRRIRSPKDFVDS